MVNKESWRQNIVHLKANKVVPFSFGTTQTKPNVLQLKQTGAGVVGISQYSNVATHAEIEINDTTWKKYVHPQGVDCIFLVSSEDTTLYLNSAEASDLTIQDLQATQHVEGTLWIATLAGELPAGNNSIGKVNVTDGSHQLQMNTDGSINAKIKDLIVAPDGSLNVGFRDWQIFSDGTGGVQLHDTQGHVLYVNADGSINTSTKITNGTNNLNINSDGSINAKLPLVKCFPNGAVMTDIYPKFIPPTKITLVAGTPYNFGLGAKIIYAIKSTLTDLLIKDSGTEVWKGDYHENVPFYITVGLQLISATGGDVYIMYENDNDQYRL